VNQFEIIWAASPSKDAGPQAGWHPRALRDPLGVCLKIKVEVTRREYAPMLGFFFEICEIDFKRKF
jgi:hypothetical protein